MTVVELALLQLTPETTVQGNLEKGLDARKKADARGAALALFPEAWSDGYASTRNCRAPKL